MSKQAGNQNSNSYSLLLAHSANSIALTFVRVVEYFPEGGCSAPLAC